MKSKLFLSIICLFLFFVFSKKADGQGIDISSGGSIAITGAGSIEINNGGLTNNGTYTKGTETLTFTGTTAKSISGSSSLSVNNLIINNNGGINSEGNLTAGSLNISAGSFSVDSSSAVTISSTLTNSVGNSGLFIKSALTSTGSIIFNNASVSGTVERFLTKGKWHVISIPVSGQAIGSFVSNVSNSIGANGVSWGMMPYDPPNNLWGAYFQTATAGNFKIGEGYMVRRKSTGSDGPVTSLGGLQYGNLTISGLISGKWNAIGNPYTSSIGITSSAASTANFLNVNSTYLDMTYGAIYIWDEQPGYAGTTRSDYKVISNAGYPSSATKNYLQSGQGFLIKMNAGYSSVDFTSSMQTHQNSESYMKKSGSFWPGFELFANSKEFSISTVITFNENMTTDLDPTYDAGVLKGNPSLSLYSKSVVDNGYEFAIQCLPMVGIENFIIPLGINFPSGGEIIFSAKTDYLPSGCKVVLEDRETGAFTNLEDTSGYNVVLPETPSVNGRFFIHTNSSQLSTDVTKVDPVKVYSFGKKIFIKGEIDTNEIIYLYSLQGNLLKAFSPEGSTNPQLDADEIADGIYLLTLSNNQERKTYKVFLGNTGN